MIVVGVHGQIGAGKDTIGQRLIDRWKFTKTSFAEALKREVYNRLHKTLTEYVLESPWTPGVVHESDINKEIRRILWADRTPFTRALLQEYGTEVRRADDPDYWVKQWQHSIRGLDRVVVTDVRFQNEARAVKEVGGYLVRVARPGHDGDEHASENDLRDWAAWDTVIVNDGTIEDLWLSVDRWIESLLEVRQAG